MAAEPSIDDVNDMSDSSQEMVPQVSNAAISELAKSIVGAVNDAHGPRKVDYGEFMANRSVHRDKPELTRKIYQNGILLTRRQMSADAINLANALKPGTFANGRVAVVAVADGTQGVALDIRYNNKTPDDRMAFKSLYPTFEHLLASLVRENELVTA